MVDIIHRIDVEGAPRGVLRIYGGRPGELVVSFVTEELRRTRYSRTLSDVLPHGLAPAGSDWDHHSVAENVASAPTAVHVAAGSARFSWRIPARGCWLTIELDSRGAEPPAGERPAAEPPAGERPAAELPDVPLAVVGGREPPAVTGEIRELVAAAGKIRGLVDELMAAAADETFREMATLLETLARHAGALEARLSRLAMALAGERL